MPTIPLLRDQPKRKREYHRTENRELRQKTYHTDQWKNLRAVYFKANPLCECCKAMGKVVEGIDVHHIVSPFTHKEQLNELLIDPENLATLCKEHHSAIHTLRAFRNRERKDPNELAKWIKENQRMYEEYIEAKSSGSTVNIDINDINPKYLLEGGEECRKLIIRQHIDDASEQRKQPVYKFNCNGELIASYNSVTEAKEDGFSGRYDTFTIDKNFYSREMNPVIPSVKYRVYAYSIDAALLGRFETITEAAEHFDIDLSTVSKSISEKRPTRYWLIFSDCELTPEEVAIRKHNAKNRVISNNRVFLPTEQKVLKRVALVDNMGTIIQLYDSTKEAAESNHLPTMQVGRCVHGVIPSCNGKIFKYVYRPDL